MTRQPTGPLLALQMINRPSPPLAATTVASSDTSRMSSAPTAVVKILDDFIATKAHADVTNRKT